MFYLLCKIEILGKGHLKTGWLDQLHSLTPVSLSASECRELMVTVFFALKFAIHFLCQYFLTLI